jgi:hypothetical protein
LSADRLHNTLEIAKVLLEEGKSFAIILVEYLLEYTLTTLGIILVSSVVISTKNHYSRLQEFIKPSYITPHWVTSKEDA